MTLPALHPLLNPDLPPHRQVPSDAFIWTGAGLWLGRGEAFTPTAHIWTEREVRQARLSGAQSALDRLTR
ncbi:hypothetical protein [Deinococcus radiotolerans]|uniref:Uncharacterized protein n=1 Tax=Deinococcus radiotolerans TaxID=1309407 RepID=A0ABQ2FPP2_9DEIO|nr:hypothetical protein [Deinococcus radiotolerans]GGL14647.1 hypothetical protein GCM10010844_36810 [Deinococcus radiotolerans]